MGTQAGPALGGLPPLPWTAAGPAGVLLGLVPGGITRLTSGPGQGAGRRKGGGMAGVGRLSRPHPPGSGAWPFSVPVVGKPGFPCRRKLCSAPGTASCASSAGYPQFPQDTMGSPSGQLLSTCTAARPSRLSLPPPCPPQSVAGCWQWLESLDAQRGLSVGSGVPGPRQCEGLQRTRCPPGVLLLRHDLSKMGGLQLSALLLPGS